MYRYFTDADIMPEDPLYWRMGDEIEIFDWNGWRHSLISKPAWASMYVQGVIKEITVDQLPLKCKGVDNDSGTSGS